MKRILTLVTTLALVALFAMPAQAQDSGATRIMLQGGLSMSNFTGDDVPSDKSSKTGFLAGIGFEYFVAQNWSLALEANWLGGLGAKFGSGTDEADVKLSYFSFPLTLNFAFPLGQNEKTWLGLGAGIAANLKLTCDGSLADPTAGASVDCGDDANSVAWTVPLNAGIGFKAADAAVVYLNARYQLGLSNTFKDVGSTSIDAKMSWWEFVIGVSFIP